MELKLCVYLLFQNNHIQLFETLLVVNLNEMPLIGYY